MSIELIPTLKTYPQIEQAYKNEKLIIFVGAGLSKIWGCKSWSEQTLTIFFTKMNLQSN